MQIFIKEITLSFKNFPKSFLAISSTIMIMHDSRILNYKQKMTNI